MSRLVDVYPYRKEQNEIKFLIFKRTTEVIYPNQWRMIAGKVNKGEKRYEAALRELEEETQLTPSLFWSLPSINKFYDHRSDTVHLIPAFGAEVRQDQTITLNYEHSKYKWISEKQIEDYISWPEQQRLMRLLATIVTNNEILEEWIIEP